MPQDTHKRPGQRDRPERWGALSSQGSVSGTSALVYVSANACFVSPSRRHLSGADQDAGLLLLNEPAPAPHVPTETQRNRERWRRRFGKNLRYRL